MNNFIKHIFKLNLENELYYICKYYTQTTLVNLIVFKKEHDRFEELFTNEIDPTLIQSITKKIKENDLQPTSEEEYNKFEKAIKQYKVTTSKRIHSFLHKKAKDIKMKHIGEFSGNNYIVTKHKNAKYLEIYSLKMKDEGNVQEIEELDPKFSELICLDYITRLPINEEVRHIKLNDNIFVGLKNNTIQGTNYLSVVYIEIGVEEVTCIKGFLLKKIWKESYVPLPFEDFNQHKSEILKKDGKILANKLVKNLKI